jgi:hypothetical protein
MNQIKKYKVSMACSTYGKARGAYGILVGKTEVKTSRRRFEDNIEMNFQEVGWRSWIGLIWLGIGTSGGHLWMPQGTSEFHKIMGISLVAEDL